MLEIKDSGKSADDIKARWLAMIRSIPQLLGCNYMFLLLRQKCDLMIEFRVLYITCIFSYEE